MVDRGRAAQHPGLRGPIRCWLSGSVRELLLRCQVLPVLALVQDVLRMAISIRLS